MSTVKDNRKPLTREHKAQQDKLILLCNGLVLVLLVCWVFSIDSKQYLPHKIKLVSMDFAATVHNDSTSHYGRDDPLRSARWDLLIRVPKELVGNYICLQGNIQASLLYKNVALATSSIQSYNKLELGAPQVLSISAVASEEDLSGAIGKEIMEAIKKGNEVRFGSRLSLTDCREETEKGTMSYECDETTLRLEPSGSNDDQIKATAFGKHPTCKTNHVSLLSVYVNKLRQALS